MLENETPYKTWHNKKPHLAGIQEFGAAAYVKDLKAGKLGVWAQVDQFVGYDSEFKGYRIYWPGKRSVTVEHDIVFNENDVWAADRLVNLSNGVLSEGEIKSEKSIQHPKNCAKDLQNLKYSEEQSEKEPLDNSQDPDMSSTIPFPTVPLEPNNQNSTDEDQQKYSQGQCPWKEKDAYKQMNEGLITAMAHFEDFDDEDEPLPSPKEDFEDFECNQDNFASSIGQGLYTPPPIPEGFRPEFQTLTGISGIRLVLFWL